MLKPLEQWICDTCGGIIERSSGGLVIWKGDDLGMYSFKIIHTGRCDHEDHSSSMHIEPFLGIDGLSHLLSFLSVGSIMEINGMSGSSRVVSLGEFVDLIRRLQTPYYEEARRHFAKPEVSGWWNDANEYAPYLVENLKKIVQEHQDV